MIASDRMIVRVSYTRERSLGATFDENQNRSTQHLQYEDWAEFMVVWRKDRIELYEDYVCSTAFNSIECYHRNSVIIDLNSRPSR